MRSYLRRAGVYVGPSVRNVTTIAKTLVDTINEQERHKWVEQDFKDLADDLKDQEIISKFIDENGYKSRQQQKQPSSQENPPNAPNQSDASNQPNAPNHPNPPLQSTALQLAKIQADEDRKIDSVAKAYTNEQRYSGSNGSLDYKLRIFRDTCMRFRVSGDDNVTRALPTMLKGPALDYFFEKELSSFNFNKILDELRKKFETETFFEKNYEDWEATTLNSIMEKNPDKSTVDNLEILVETLTKMQYGLQPEYKGPVVLRRKLKTACRNVPACTSAVINLPKELPDAINTIHVCILTYEKV